ncbi:MAG: DHH family phosphoesterase, partial [Nanoarchaeota archaeon]
MIEKIKNTAVSFLKQIENSGVQIVSHFDTDGITSASIITKALKKKDVRFNLRILKQLEKSSLLELKKMPTLFLDLGSGSLKEISSHLPYSLILDHHEIPSEIPENISLINPHLSSNEPISSAGISYLFAKEIVGKDKELATLAVIGMIGDMLDQEVSRLNKQILDDSEATIKRGLLLYPSTRPVNKALEYSSNIFIPNVTGNSEGALELVRNLDIGRNGKGYKSLMELDEEEHSRLLTEIMLRIGNKQTEKKIIGNIYLLKFLDKLEDGRDISSMINACSRMDRYDLSLCLCLGSQKIKESAETLYASYKQHIVSALRFVSESEKISGKRYTIINAKDKIKDTIIGTIASIISNSS